MLAWNARGAPFSSSACKPSASERHSYLSATLAIRATTHDTPNNDDLINPATKAALGGASIAAAVLNDRIVSCRLTRLVRPISASAFKRRVASRRRLRGGESGQSPSTSLGSSLYMQGASTLTIEKNAPGREKMTTERTISLSEFHAISAWEHGFPPSSIFRGKWRWVQFIVWR